MEDPEIGDVTSLYVDGLTMLELPAWSDTQGFLAKAMCLLLLSSLMERGLKLLCKDLSTTDDEVEFAKNTGNKIATYICYLQEKCSLPFIEPSHIMAVRKNCVKIRNAFAHGDWDEVRRLISGQSLRGAFGAYSTLLREIESAYLVRKQ